MRMLFDLLRKIAIRVSKSGGVMSDNNPQPKRVTNRSGKLAISFGLRSLVNTICFFKSYK